MFRLPCLLIACVSLVQSAPPPPKEVVAYLFPQERTLTPDEVAVSQLTRINYAFANVKKGRLVPGFANDAANLRTLVAAKQHNPRLRILISVGGWSWSGGFSDMARTPQSRSLFIASAVEYVKANSLDGVDIDWEYPGSVGAGNKYRPGDKENFTALLADLRSALDEEGRVLKRHLLLSIAAGASEEFVAKTEMRKAQEYLDSVNLMSYDYYVPSVDHIAGHHAPLHENPADPKHISAERSVRVFEEAGVPARKIVLGIPFYGHAWTQVEPLAHGLFQAGKKSDLEPDYKKVIDLQGAGGYSRYWDPVAQAPYLYNAEKRTFISYEDKESIAAKCRFAVAEQLAGVMFWEYSNDPSGRLLNAVTSNLSMEHPAVAHPTAGKRY